MDLCEESIGCLSGSPCWQASLCSFSKEWCCQKSVACVFRMLGSCKIMVRSLILGLYIRGTVCHLQGAPEISAVLKGSMADVREPSAGTSQLGKWSWKQKSVNSNFKLSRHRVGREGGKLLNLQVCCRCSKTPCGSRRPWTNTVRSSWCCAFLQKAFYLPALLSRLFRRHSGMCQCPKVLVQKQHQPALVACVASPFPPCILLQAEYPRPCMRAHSNCTIRIILSLIFPRLDCLIASFPFFPPVVEPSTYQAHQDTKAWRRCTSSRTWGSTTQRTAGNLLVNRRVLRELMANVWGAE